MQDSVHNESEQDLFGSYGYNFGYNPLGWSIVLMKMIRPVVILTHPHRNSSYYSYNDQTNNERNGCFSHMKSSHNPVHVAQENIQ